MVFWLWFIGTALDIIIGGLFFISKFVFKVFVCNFKEKRIMNVTKRDLIIIATLFIVGFICGLSIGYNAKECKECTEFNVKIKQNEKTIDQNTPIDSVMLEWQRRNSTSR